MNPSGYIGLLGLHRGIDASLIKFQTDVDLCLSALTPLMRTLFLHPFQESGTKARTEHRHGGFYYQCTEP